MPSMKTQISIVYGSQSGNSRVISEILKTKITNFETELINIENFSLENFLTPGTYIFICSTYGNGDFPFCAQYFYNILTSGYLSSEFLKNSNIAIFGMGDSSYQKYNFASRKLYKAFESLGANFIGKLGMGNAQDKMGYYTGFYLWLDETLPKLDTLTIEEREIIQIQKKVYDARLVSKKILTAEGYTPTMLEMGFDIENIEKFEPGDAISIYPRNTNWEKFADFIGWKDNALEMEIDFNSIPFFHCLSEIFTFLKENDFNDKYFKKKEHKEMIIKKIEELSQNFEEYYSYIKLGKRSFYDLFRDLNLQFPLVFLKQLIPKIIPRYFTLTKKDSYFYLTITLVQYTVLQREKKGLCSEYFNKMDIGTYLKCKIITSHLDCSSEKLLFICTGAGISLARSFWQFFPNKKIVIFYGYRLNDCDKIYTEEIDNHPNITVYYAPSRDNEKKYVQKIFEEKFTENIADYAIYVSGRTRLNREVREMFKRKYGEELYFQAETW